MAFALNSQPEGLSFKDAVAKYPEAPALVILKIDVQRRGIFYTDRALPVPAFLCATLPRPGHSG